MTTAARRVFPAVAVLGFLSACSGGDATGSGGDGGGSGGTGGTGGGMPSLDQSNISFVDNLLAKVEDGEWTLGEGLVASLRLMAGEIDASSVLRHPELVDYEGTGIVAMAYDYLDDGPDADAKSEIRRLLDLVVLSNERLEAMAGLDAQSPALGGALPRLKSSAEDCLSFFVGYELPPGVGQCLEVLSVTISGTEYRLFSPAPPLPTGGWMEEHYDRTIEALNDTVPVYKGFGSLPPANLVFSAKDTVYSAAAHDHLGGICGVAIYKSMQSATDGDFKQILAHELAHCFQTETFVEQNKVDYAYIKWREEGLANYLSNVIYPTHNWEWGSLDALAQYELTTTLFDRAYSNFLFFQYLGQRVGNTGIFAIVETLPGSWVGAGLVDQQIALAAYPRMDEMYHDFAKAMTDGTVIDTSGAPIPYQISEVNQPTFEITEPHRHKDEMEPFGVVRYRIVVEAGKEADLNLMDQGEIRDSSRPTNEIEWGELPTTLQGDECDAGVILVVTTTKPDSGFNLDSLDVRDLPGGTQGGEAICSIEGEWLVDNSSLNTDFGVYTLDYMSGEIRITFHDDGNAEVVYDSFEYHLSRDSTVSLGNMQFNRHEEFTYTTNAEGVTTYEVDGNEIAFGHVFESSYLEGTETVHQVTTYTPSSGLLTDIDEMTTREATGWGMFSGYPSFGLESSGSVLQFVTGITVTLNRVGSGE
jgi:hypothetical protein